MATLTQGEYRKSTGYIRLRLNPRNVSPLLTSRNVDDELWTLIEQYSEIKTVGKKFIVSRSANAPINTWFSFQAYIRQAKTYYESAKTLSHRSAGLLFYYCFLNLAKASLVIKDLTIANNKITHGISYDVKNRNAFKNQKIKIHQDGIFPRFYEWQFGKKINPQSLGIASLFSYCTDISYQSNIAGISQQKIFNCHYVLCSDSGKKITWPVIAIPKSQELLRYRSTFRDFFKNFEVVEIPQYSCREMFSMDASEQNQHNFFQSKNTYPLIISSFVPTFEIRDYVLSQFQNCFQTFYFSENADFNLSLPYMFNKQIRMDETIAIYLIFFYLSSLVRYKPQYLESLLNKKEAWLIESFIRSSPVTLLRSMISRIIGDDFIIISRR